MTGGERTGAAREVPPPRPVPPTPGPGAPGPVGGRADDPSAAPDSGRARAGRLLADAVAGLLGQTGGRAGAGASTGAMAGALRDVVAAVTSALGAGGGRAEGAAPGDRDGSARASRAPGTLLGDLLTAAVPRLPIRDAGRLRLAHPGRDDEQIADALVARAARLTAGVGAATGGLSAASWFAPPSLVALPLELAAETVLTAAVEIVLLGELHELAGRAPHGDRHERATAYLASWSAQRAVQRTAGAGLGSVLGSAGWRALRRRMGRRLARNAPAAAPFLVGAMLGSRGNRKATETLARRIRADLGEGS